MAKVTSAGKAQALARAAVARPGLPVLALAAALGEADRAEAVAVAQVMGRAALPAEGLVLAVAAAVSVAGGEVRPVQA